MTRDDVIRMARQACGPDVEDPLQDGDMLMLQVDEMLRFAALVAADEREACRQLCNGIGREYLKLGMHEAVAGATDCVEAIRARGEQ